MKSKQFLNEIWVEPSAKYTIFLLTSFIVLAVMYFFLGNNPGRLEYTDIAPEIFGLLLDGVLFVGVLGLFQIALAVKQTRKVQQILFRPIVKITADFEITFLKGINQKGRSALSISRQTGKMQKPRVARLSSEEAVLLKSLAESHLRLFEALAPVASQSSPELFADYFQIIEFLSRINRDLEIPDRSTPLRLVQLTEQMGVKLESHDKFSASLDKIIRGDSEAK